MEELLAALTKSVWKSKREGVKMAIQADNDEPYLRGRADYARDLMRYQNPYEDTPEPYGTTYWESWFDGWDDAHEESKEIVNLQ
jgi:hypothetical protein